MESTDAAALLSNVRAGVSHDLAIDIQEDIVGDVLLAFLSSKMPESLRTLITTYTDKNVQMYVKPRDEQIYTSEFSSNRFGENRITGIVDEKTLIPFEERFVVEID